MFTGVALLSGTPPSAANIKKKLTEMASDNTVVAASNSSSNNEVVKKGRKGPAQQFTNARNNALKQGLGRTWTGIRFESVIREVKILRVMQKDVSCS